VHANFFNSKRDKGANVSALLSSQIKGLSPRVKGLGRALGLSVILGGSGLLASCHSAVTEGRSPVYVVVDSLLGASVQKTGSQPTFENTLRSDVETKGSIFEDPGQVTMHIELKDITSTTGPTSNNNVTFNHYRVQFRRTDGRNVQGVDVPYAFEGAVTFNVTPGGTTAGFTLVRVQSKLEPPLITLAGGGGSIVISTIADVTFYGKDTTGTDVTATGSISVNFADWADPTT
jgi:hypothetical protein